MNHDLIDVDRLAAAYEKVRFELLQERQPGGHWVGELATSALSTATAVSALSLVERRCSADLTSSWMDDATKEQIRRIIITGIGWLADRQNEDGGWGDTDQSYSNIATTMLAIAAFHLTGVPARHQDLLSRAEAYIERQGGVSGLRRRYGRDKTFAVPILTNCALAGIVNWREVSPLPFELACFPQAMYRLLRLPVVSYAIPALVAIGQCRHFHRKPWNPITRFARRLAASRSLEVLRAIQPESGGFLEAIPLTSFVVMSMASIGQGNHPVTRRGVEFLLRSVRPDGSWPIDTNLATWNTTLAVNALAGTSDDCAELADLDWLLACQYRDRHPYTGADPGGWGWSDLSGAVPDADDTPGALLALAAFHGEQPSPDPRIESAAAAGVTWLLNLQNSDGGWPTFCRGWGKLPFDRSGADLTAHVLRAFAAWQPTLGDLRVPCQEATQRGLAYLERTQREDGSWFPLWFGNQDHPEEENPVFGTARVLLAYRDLRLLDDPRAQRGKDWLVANQNTDGSWGGTGASRTGKSPTGKSPTGKSPTGKSPTGKPPTGKPPTGTVEETALAVDSLAAFSLLEREPLAKGVNWLINAVEADQHRQPAPIGFYFSKLWYYEKLYPVIFSVSALGEVLKCEAAHREPASKPAQMACEVFE